VSSKLKSQEAGIARAKNFGCAAFALKKATGFFRAGVLNKPLRNFSALFGAR
jgi:hypothetical protein